MNETCSCYVAGLNCLISSGEHKVSWKDLKSFPNWRDLPCVVNLNPFLLFVVDFSLQVTKRALPTKSQSRQPAYVGTVKAHRHCGDRSVCIDYSPQSAHRSSGCDVIPNSTQHSKVNNHPFCQSNPVLCCHLIKL